MQQTISLEYVTPEADLQNITHACCEIYGGFLTCINPA